MPASENEVRIIGNVTRDIEIKRTNGGTAVCEMGVAVNEQRKDQNGEWQEETLFLDVTLWGRTAEIADEYVGKGTLVQVKGRLRMDAWTDQTGQGRKKLKVVADRIQLLGSKSEQKPKPKQVEAPVPDASDFPF